MIDIGVNLTSSQFAKDWQQVIDSAIEEDVAAMIITGSSLKQSIKAYQMTWDYPGILFSTAGIHPHEAKTFEPQVIDQLSILLDHTQVVAVGECGLDFNRNFSSRNEQLRCFEAQLVLAVEKQLPVFLHQRDAWVDYIELIKKYRNQLVGAVAHCFTEGEKQLRELLDLDVHIGVTGWICDERRGKELQQCVSVIPLDRIMVETDAPYLFPRDLKLLNPSGKKLHRNEPQFLPHIVAVLANYMDIEVQQLIDASTFNAQAFFKL